MRRQMFRWGLEKKLVLVFLLAIFISACTVVTNDGAARATPKPLPPWIRSVTPAPGASIPHSVFVLDGLAEDVLWFGGQGFDTGFQSAVCVKFGLRQLASAGDDFSFEFLENHATLQLNGKDYGKPDHIFAFAELVTYKLPDGEAMSIPDSPFCWLVETEPGEQSAVVHFERSDGSVAVFEWKFILTAANSSAHPGRTPR